MTLEVPRVEPAPRSQDFKAATGSSSCPAASLKLAYQESYLNSGEDGSVVGPLVQT